MIRVAEFTKLEELRCLRETWNEVLQKSRDINVFSSWEWVSRWWQHFGSSRELRILVAQENDETIGIAPFMMSKYSFGALGKMSRIDAQARNFVSVYEKDDAKRRTIARGKALFFEPDLDQMLVKAIEAGRLEVVANPARAVASSDISFVAVGEPSLW